MTSDKMGNGAKAPNNLPLDFKFDASLVRTVVKDGEPWFVAKDVCDILELEDPSVTVSRLDDDQQDRANVCTTAGIREMLIVSESGLYSLIFTSRKPEAKRFRKWIASEVLPEIRKTGAYKAGHGRGGFLGLKNEEVDYERWLHERALIDGMIICTDMEKISWMFVQHLSSDPEKSAARADQNFRALHDAIRDNTARARDFLRAGRPAVRGAPDSTNDSPRTALPVRAGPLHPPVRLS